MTNGGLRQGIRLVDVVSLGAGMAIGVSLFSIFAPAARLAGTGLPVAVLLATAPMIVFAVVYAFMGSTVPTSGASYEWPTRFVHPFVGYIIAWLRILGSTGAMVVLALVLVRHWSALIDLPVKQAIFGVFLLFYVLNVLGVSVASKAQTLLFGLLLTAVIVFVAVGAPRIEPAHFSPPLSAGWEGVLVSIPLLVSLYLGIEAAAEVGEEIRDARRTFARGIAISIGTTLLIYAAMALVTLGTLGVDQLTASDAPLRDVAEQELGPVASMLIIAAATLAIATSLNALFMIFSRYLFAMGRRGVLPAALARVHPRFGTPHVAATVALACCTAGLLLPADLVFLFLAVNVPTMLKYLGTCLAAVMVARRHPELLDGGGLRLRRAVVQGWAVTGIVAAAAIIVVGFSADWRPYAVLGAWAALGLAYWFKWGRIPIKLSNGMRPL